jgi:surface antigen
MNRSALPIPAVPLEPLPTRRSLRNAPAPAAFVLPKIARKRSIRSRIVGAFTVILIPGFLVTSSIPAMALGFGDGEGADGALSNALVDAQTVSVASGATGTDASRDNFDATTQSELDAKRAAARARVAAASAAATDGDYGTVTPRAAGDDYPWRNSGGLSPLSYVTRQCTDFVAWRLNRDAGTTSAPFKYVWSGMTPGGGSASQWAGAWRSHGWKTSHKPVAGAVAWFQGNHVAYVKSVSGDDVVLEEYNWGGDRSYHTRTMPASGVALFLYPPP